jgi:hypothetical protein
MLTVFKVNADAERAVQESVNNFLMTSQWISSVPVVFFAAIAGALSDEFGRKPLMFFPILGSVITLGANMINYAFIEQLPLEFFYLDNVASFFGGDQN